MVVGGGVALVEAVGAGFDAAVGDDDGEVAEGAAEDVGEVVEGFADDFFEVVVEPGVEFEEFVFVGVDVETGGGEAFGAFDDAVEVVFGDGGPSRRCGRRGRRRCR